MHISKIHIYIKSFYPIGQPLGRSLVVFQDTLKNSFVGRTKFTIITVVRSPFVFKISKEQFTRTYFFGFFSLYNSTIINLSSTLLTKVSLIVYKSTTRINKFFLYNIKMKW